MFTEALLLYLPRLYHPLAYACAAFALRGARYVLERHWRYFYLYVDAVEQRAAYLVQVALYLPWRAYAFVRRVVVITARTRVHRRHEHERTGVFHGVFRPRYGDFAVFEGLAEHLKRGLVELWQLVGEQHAVVGKRYFPWLGVCPSADKRDLGNRMMGRAERALGYERHVFAQLSGHRMDLRCFKTFSQRERRKY